MFSKKYFNSIEPLEARIAPASVVSSAKFIFASTGSPIIMHAGEVLTTGGSVEVPGVGKVGAGAYLLYVEKGDAVIYTMDRNNNGVLDFNEITGIAAGDGLRITSFVDIYGDIVTNLNPNLTLTDSDAKTANGRDGRVVLNNTIEKIELRSLTTADVLDENGDGDTLLEVATRLALSSYSIHGNIYAGKGFGIVTSAGVADPSSGLVIDDSGRAFQDALFTGGGADFYAEGRTPLKPTVGFIRTGSAVSGEWFSFTASRNLDISGYITNFQAPAGQPGANIAGVNPVGKAFNIGGLFAGDGGTGAAGGNIVDVTFNGDDSGGYIVQAGNGGSGPSGGVGGSVTNFQDLNSVTGKIVIQSGHGGGATTGTAGNGGDILLGTVNVNGGLGIQLGNGGDGFTSGGTGASLLRATITTPEGAVQFGTNNIGTTHVAPLILDAKGFPVTGALPNAAYGVIGRFFGVDFNHDGFGDLVIASSAPNSLSVVLGDGTGDFLIDPGIPGVDATDFNDVYRIELDAPVNPEALVVADFNQDGFLDIATASSAPGSFGGISVFLTKSEDVNDDGRLTTLEDINHNGIVDFLGFRTARQTFLPSLADGDPDVPLLGGFYFYERSAVPILSLAAGDFDGDGYTDLAATATYITQVTLVDHQILFFLKANVDPVLGDDGVQLFKKDAAGNLVVKENGDKVPLVRQTGEFYAEIGTKRNGATLAAPNPFVPFIDLGAGTKSVVQASALRTSDIHDQAAAAVVGGGAIRVLDNSVPSLFGPNLFTSVTANQWGRVDTDRQLGPNHVNLAGVSVRDFAILDSAGEQYVDVNTNGRFDAGDTFTDSNVNGQFDPEQDGVADISLITQNTPGFMLSMISTGVNNTFFTIPVHNPNIDNAGTSIPGFGFASANAIREVDGNGDGMYNEVAVLSIGGAPGYVVVQLNVANVRPAGIVANPGATVAGAFPSFIGGGADTNVVSFDSFIPDLSALQLTQYATALPNVNPGSTHAVEIVGDPVGFFPPIGLVNVSERYVRLDAGDGGNGLVGVGGNGGQLGTGNNGDISLTLPSNLAFEGVVNLFGGVAGDGFSRGGDGGSVGGVLLRGSGGGSFSAQLFAGDGGFGVGGNGGNGGSLYANSIERGGLFQAGNGGRGRIGGNGGDILGNGVGGDFYDTQSGAQNVIAGIGGNGILGGGRGGDITNFRGDFSGGGAFLSYIAGPGGNAISGPGGNGGSIARSTPLTDVALLTGEVLLQAGDGGNGRSGGNGGGIAYFTYKPTGSSNPSVISVLAGHGGHGIAGLGGSGGSIANISIPTVGKLPFPVLTDYTFNRILAGNGGDSSGRVGGTGGSVVNVTSSNSDGAFVVSAGAGGNGLVRGGDGGSVRATSLNTGGETFAKALVVAGAGGNAFAFIPNRNDTSFSNQLQKAFGGVVGRGGNGGSIENFEQSGASNARVDLIAGDGGNTLNYGTAADVLVPVGIGGSVGNLLQNAGDIGIRIAGTIGNTTATVPIKSYNNIFNHETVADFIDRNLRAPVVDPLNPPDFSDATGVVGLVAGSAGRLKEVQTGYESFAGPLLDGRPVYRSLPALQSFNGNAYNISAGGIMSMVAGSVDRVAAIQLVGGIQLTSGGILGSDKSPVTIPIVHPFSDYLDKDGVPIIEPFLDSRLIDGALIYKSYVPLFNGDALPNNPRIFKLA